MNGSQYSPQDCTNNNGTPSPHNKSSSSRIPQPRQCRLPSVSSRDSPQSPSAKQSSPGQQQMMSPLTPLSRAGSREDMQVASSHAERWKARYQEADRKYKGLLVKNEKTLREHNELERRYSLLQERCELTEQQLIEKESKLGRLRAVSEKVYKEYDQLKNQYDVETQAMHKAMQSAGQWYQQNRKLKRRSAALLQRLPPQALQDLDSQDATDAASESSGGEELEGLRETVAELSREVARLQTEINSVKLQEFEATELNVNLTQELEQEKEWRLRAEENLKNSAEEVERHKRLARHLASEVATFRDQLEQYRSQASLMKCEAESAKKERDVLAHRSSLYMEGWADFMGESLQGLQRPSSVMGLTASSEDLLAGRDVLLRELESLRAEMEQERIRHTKEVDELQDKLMDQETDNEIFILQEKLNLAEEDAKRTKIRAEKAEQKLEELKTNRKSVMNRVSMFENIKKSDLESSMTNIYNGSVSMTDITPAAEVEEVAGPPPPPPPPVPPPPPPIPLSLNGVGNLANGAKPNSTAIADMANLLGLKQSTVEKKKPSGGAIDEIINQIKGGRFHLKSTEQKTPPKKPKEEPAALKEMLNILGTLRRRPKSVKEPKEVEDKK